MDLYILPETNRNTAVTTRSFGIRPIFRGKLAISGKNSKVVMLLPTRLSSFWLDLYQSTCGLGPVWIFGIPGNVRDCYTPEKKTKHLKIGVPKGKIVFQPPVFRCYMLVSGRVGGPRFEFQTTGPQTVHLPLVELTCWQFPQTWSASGAQCLEFLKRTDLTVWWHRESKTPTVASMGLVSLPYIYHKKQPNA